MTELKKASVKSKVEAILFSTGHRISLDEVSKLCRSRREDVFAALQELKKEYEEKQSSLMLAEDGDFWKFTVRDHFIPIIRKIVTETELTKSVLETLAVIAFKYPILQSDLIKIRTNKSYEHLMGLEKSGYISRQRHGRTNLIKLTEKFFRYFDLTEESLREKFKDFGSIAQAIKEKEEEVEKIKVEQRQKAEDLRKEDEKIRKEIEALDESDEEFEIPLEIYKTKSNDVISEEFSKQGSLIQEKDKIGELEIIDEEQKEMKIKETRTEKIELPPELKEMKIDNGHTQAPPEDLKPIPKQKKKNRGIQLTAEMKKIVDEKVERITGMQKEDKAENTET
ncbi:MAG: SMC-Scp complex subunit ScpB [Nanoarchaeota archaeon]